MQQMSRLQEEINGWHTLLQRVEDAEELASLKDEVGSRSG